MRRPHLSVLLADNSDLASEVRDTLDLWARADLIQSALWVPLGEDPVAAPPDAFWLGTGVPVDLLRALASEQYELYRLVAVHFADGQATAGPLSDVTLSVHRLVNDALAPSQRMVRLNMLVPATGVHEIPESRLSIQAEANVVVAPEERISPRHATVSVDQGDDFVWHAASATSTVGALWQCMAEGPFDGENLQASSGSPQVVVVRSFERLLQVRGAIDDVSLELFGRRRTEGWAAQAVGAAPARDPLSVTERAMGQYIAKYRDRFTYEALPEPTRPRQATVGIGKALLMMLHYIGKGLRDLPGDLIGRAATRTKDAMSDFAQRVTFGSESTMAVRFGGQALPDQRDHGDATANATHLAMQLLEQSAGGAPTPPAAGEAWRDLRRVVFSAADGSPMPDGIDEPRDGATREVITQPSYLAPDPGPGAFELDRSLLADAELPAVAFEPIRPNDPFQASTVDAVLEEAIQRALHPEQAEDEGTSSDEAAEPDDDLAERLRQAQAALREWISEREESFTWRLAKHVAGSLRSARITLFRALKRVREGEAAFDGSALASAQKTLRRRWLGVTLLVALIAYLTYDSGYDQVDIERTATILWSHIVVFTLIWLGALLSVFIKYQHRMFQIKYEYDRSHAAYLWAIDQATDSARQVVSLASMYDQLRHWAEVVGWMLHRPQGRLDRAKDPGVDVAAVPTPPSTILTIGEISEPSRRRVSALVGREIFGRGWVNDLFSRYLSDSMAGLKYEQGMGEADPTPDPDWDLREPTPLRHLLSDLESGRPALQWTADVIERVADEMSETSPDELLTTVHDGDTPRDLDPSEFFEAIIPNAGEVSAEELYLPLWAAQARMEAAGRIARSMVWLPTALHVDDESETIERKGVVTGTVKNDRTLTLASVRLDRTQPVTSRELSIFQRDVSEPLADIPAKDDEVW